LQTCEGKDLEVQIFNLKTNIKMKNRFSINRLTLAFASLLLAVVLSGCGSKQRSRYVCNCEEQKQLQTFVKESIKPANNMSDEEMEDVVHQLRVDGIKIYCKQKAVWVDNNGSIDWTKQKFDSCDVVMDAW
jgi:hypothetical protein